jgi:hypothetical protein
MFSAENALVSTFSAKFKKNKLQLRVKFNQDISEDHETGALVAGLAEIMAHTLTTHGQSPAEAFAYLANELGYKKPNVVIPATSIIVP